MTKKTTTPTKKSKVFKNWLIGYQKSYPVEFATFNDDYLYGIFLLGFYQDLNRNKKPVPLKLVTELHKRKLIDSYVGTYNSSMM